MPATGPSQNYPWLALAGSCNGSCEPRSCVSIIWSFASGPEGAQFEEK
jgi:hypothetical protein